MNQIDARVRKLLLWEFSRSQRNKYADRRKICRGIYRSVGMWKIHISSIV